MACIIIRVDEQVKTIVVVAEVLTVGSRHRAPSSDGSVCFACLVICTTEQSAFLAGADVSISQVL